MSTLCLPRFIFRATMVLHGRRSACAVERFMARLGFCSQDAFVATCYFISIPLNDLKMCLHTAMEAL